MDLISHTEEPVVRHGELVNLGVWPLLAWALPVSSWVPTICFIIFPTLVSSVWVLSCPAPEGAHVGSPIG